MRYQLFIVPLLLLSTTIAFAQPGPARDAGAAQAGAAPGNPIVNPRDPRIPQPPPPVPVPERRNPARIPSDRNDPNRPNPHRRLPRPPQDDPNIPGDERNQNDPQNDPQNDDQFLDGIDFVGGGGYGSALYEDPGRGYADIVRSWGMRHLLDSTATKTYEEARREYLENRLFATKTYFEMRRTNDQYRADRRGYPLSFEQYVRLARIQAPDRLSVSQLDPFTGKVNWPVVLRRPEYDDLRGRLDTLFQARASGTVLAYGEIDRLSKELLDVLLADMETFSQTEYIQAKNFVQSLAYESQLVQR